MIQKLIKENKVAELKQILEANPELLNQEFLGGYNRATPLHYAIERGSDEMVEFLVEMGANLEAKLQLNYNRCYAKFRSSCKDYRGPTPLKLAIAKKQYEKAAILINAQPSILPQDIVSIGEFRKALVFHKVLENAKTKKDSLERLLQVEYKYLKYKSDGYNKFFDTNSKRLDEGIILNVLTFISAEDIGSLNTISKDCLKIFDEPCPSDIIGQKSLSDALLLGADNAA